MDEHLREVCAVRLVLGLREDELDCGDDPLVVFGDEHGAVAGLDPRGDVPPERAGLLRLERVEEADARVTVDAVDQDAGELVDRALVEPLEAADRRAFGGHRASLTWGSRIAWFRPARLPGGGSMRAMLSRSGPLATDGSGAEAPAPAGPPGAEGPPAGPELAAGTPSQPTVEQRPRREHEPGDHCRPARDERDDELLDGDAADVRDDHWKISVVQSPPWSRTSCARAGPPGRSWKSTKKSRVDLHPAVRVAVHAQQPRAQLRGRTGCPRSSRASW